MIQNLLKGFNSLLKTIVLFFVLAAVAVSSYVIWSNYRIYADAQDVRADLYEMKPTVDDLGEVDFDTLRALNPDVVAWLTAHGTNIDYPVVQGENNLTYMNRDVYGDFSLAGSIFLDSRNDSGFHDRYSIIYGHHMSNHLMFGDLDLYKDYGFFESNRTASILTQSGETVYQVLAIGEVPDSVQGVFNPDLWRNDLVGLSDIISDYSMFVWDEAMGKLVNNPKGVKVVALVTCASGNTGIRTVLFLIVGIDEDEEAPTDNIHPSDSTSVIPSDEPSSPTEEENVDLPPKTGDSLPNSPLLWICLLILSIVIICVVIFVEYKYKSKHHPKK